MNVNYRNRHVRSVPAKGCPGIACALVLALLMMMPTEETAAQLLQRREVIMQPAVAQPAGVLGGFAGNQDEVELDDGGSLKTDPDLESIMQKAERFRADKNFRVATQLLQAVLERSGDALYSSDDQIYFSMTRKVEQVLSELPPAGLAAYRIKADAEVAAMLALAGKDDEATLNQIVQQYFVSTEGDDAALQLASLYLDRHDFLGARRLLEKIVRNYPDPTVSMADVHARIALCNAFLNNREEAQQAIAKAKEIEPRHRPAEWIATELATDGSLGQARNRDLKLAGDWQMSLSGSKRYGVSRSVPAEMYRNDLVPVWQYYFEPKDRYNDSEDLKENVLTGVNAYDQEKVVATRNATEKKLLEAWREKGWRTVGQLVFDQDQLFYKTGADLISINLNQVSQQADPGAQLGDFLSWRSVWRNSYQIDPATQMQQAILKNYGQAFGRRSNLTPQQSPAPVTLSEVQLFGDAIDSQLSIHRGRLFTLEGKSFDKRLSQTPRRIVPQWNQPYRRTRDNRLVAYDAKSGMVLWSLPRASEPAQPGAAQEDAPQESPWLDDGGFMATPIGYGELVIVPVNKGGTIMIYALDPSQGGKTVWKSYLCDEPEAGAAPWSPIQLSIEGSDLLVNCGLGVMFSLDPSTGMIRFAKRYKRVGRLDDFYRRSNWSTKRAQFSGWSSDIVIPYGRQLVNFASDSKVIEAVDRDTAELIWRSEMSPIGYEVDYLLGVYDNLLFAAGAETVVAYDLNGEGRMVWGADQLFDGKQSLGRGILTPEGIFIPVQDKIYHFDLAGDLGKAKLLNKIHVDLAGAPIGNLFSDGQRFWVHGGNRLYALGVKPE